MAHIFPCWSSAIRSVPRSFWDQAFGHSEKRQTFVNWDERTGWCLNIHSDKKISNRSPFSLLESGNEFLNSVKLAMLEGYHFLFVVVEMWLSSCRDRLIPWRNSGRRDARGQLFEKAFKFATIAFVLSILSYILFGGVRLRLWRRDWTKCDLVLIKFG